MNVSSTDKAHFEDDFHHSPFDRGINSKNQREIAGFLEVPSGSFFFKTFNCAL